MREKRSETPAKASAGINIFKKKQIHCAALSSILKEKAIWFWSALLAMMCTLISYPGIWYSDSYVRVTTGQAILNTVVKTLSGQAAPLETGNAFTVIPSFFIALCYGVTRNFGLYTFCQAFGLFAAVMLLIREFHPPFRRTLTILFALSPIVYGASVYYEANVGSLIGLIMLVLLFRRAFTDKTRLDRWIDFLMVVFASLITFGYRTNALTVLPVLVVYMLLSRKKETAKKIRALGAMALGIAMTWLIPAGFQVHGESNAATPFVWEILTTIQRMEPEEQTAYLDYLDDLCGEGATRSALETSNENSVDGFMWGEQVNTEAFSAPGSLFKILGKYMKLIIDRPREWLGVKKDFLAKAMGITAPLDLYEYPYNRWDQMHTYGFNDSPQRKAFHASFLRFNEFFQWITCRPWVAFLLSVFLVALEKIRKNRKAGLYALILWLAIFYYLAYLIMIVVFQQRMFYPSLILLLTLDAVLSAEWIHRLVVFIRERKERLNKAPA